MPRLDEVDLRNEAAAAGQPIPRPTNPLGDMATRLQAMSAPDQEAFRRWVDPNYRQQTMDRALPPSMVEDRNAYLNAKREARQMQLEQQQRRMAEIEARRQQVQNVLQQINQTPATQFQRQGAAGIRALQAQEAAKGPQDFRTISQVPGSPEEQASAPSTIPQRGSNIGALPFMAGQGAYNAARTEIPYAGQVASALKGGIEAAAPVARVLPQTALMQNLGERLPNVPTPSGVAAGAAEASIPTEVWQAVIELIPGVGSVPDAVRMIKSGAPDALRALDNVLGSEAAGAFRARLASEYGGGPAGGPLGLLPEKAPGEAVMPDEVITGLEAQRSNINRTLRSLKKSEAGRIRIGTVEDAFKVGERYERGSVQRAEILQAIEGQIADLPPHRQAFIRAAFETLPDAASRRAATKAQRAAQYASAEEAFSTTAGTAEERAAAAMKARGGKQAQRFTPIGPRFTDDTHRLLSDDVIAAAKNGTINANERDNALSALNLYMTGQRLPGVVSETKKPLNLMPGEIKLLGRIFGKEVEASLQATKHVSRLQTVADLINLPRAIVTAVDISAAGRQGIILMMRNPNEARKSFGPMIRAMMSERGFEQAAKNITGNAYFEDGVRHGLDLTNIGGGPGGEEAFISGLVQKLPTWAGGGFVRGSERGYVTYLDTLRMLTYEKEAKRLERVAGRGDWPVERIDKVKGELAGFFNHATGRGDLKALNEYTPALNAVFFSPRYFVSRFQSIWDMVRPGADPYTRKIAFENLGMFVGTGMSILTAAKLSGLADVEIDPRSSDFGKIRVGNTRVDFWGGYQPIARYIVQAATGERKELFTGDIKKEFRGDIAGRFFRSKLSPAGAIFYDNVLAGGKTYEGDDTFFKSPGADTAWSEFRNRLLPLSIQDAVEGYQSGGVIGAVVGGGVSAVGGGISNIEPSDKTLKKVATSGFNKKLTEAGFPQADKGYVRDDWQAMFKRDFGENAAKFKTIDELRDDYIKNVAPKLAERDGLGETQAKADASKAFNAMPSVKAFAKAKREAELRFWRDHPELLREAVQAGAETLNDEERKILGIR